LSLKCLRNTGSENPIATPILSDCSKGLYLDLGSLISPRVQIEVSELSPLTHCPYR
jgi:hypothetical protein